MHMRKLLTVLALGALLLLGGAPAAQAATATDIVVEDTAGTLDLDTLLPAIAKIDFHEPTKVAIYTRSGRSSDNLNEEVLRFARERHPEWLSADRQKWADSLFLFALDPAGRQVGTYFGEDRKVSPAQRDEIQEATKDLLREAQWTDGTVAGVQRAARVMNRPWYESPKLYAWGGGILAVGGIGAGSTLYVRRTYRKRSETALEKGNASFADVSMDLEVTELNAKTIDDNSRYGNLVLEKYRGFSSDYTKLVQMSNEANALGAKAHSQKRTALLLERYAADATALDAMDDVIADTSMLLNKGSGWAAAWDRQLAPLREDLADLEGFLDRKESVPGSASAAALLGFKSTTASEIERWGADLASGAIDPEDGLDKIAAARAQLTVLLKAHSETVIAKYAKNSQETNLMREAMRTPEARGGRTSSHHSILGAVYAPNRFWSVVGLSTGYREGQSSVRQSRTASSSSSGGSTGYGSSGGSFSGSGSSSRF